MMNIKYNTEKMSAALSNKLCNFAKYFISLKKYENAQGNVVVILLVMKGK